MREPERPFSDRSDMGNAASDDTQPQFSFEEIYLRLEKTVEALESGNLTLDEATNLYEEGMRLAQMCSDMLSKAELKVTQLKEGYSGLREVDEPPEWLAGQAFPPLEDEDA